MGNHNSLVKRTHFFAHLAQGWYVYTFNIIEHRTRPTNGSIVTTPEDIELALKYQVNGVIVSNHGGRQLDGMPSTLDALRVCAPIAKGRIPIAVDGGIRRGSDIFKALALGANFCFIGRIPFWGLAVSVQNVAQ